MAQISKKKKFVADGVFYAELNEFLTREFALKPNEQTEMVGYSGVEVRVTPTRTEIIIRATRTKNVLGEKGQRIRELTSAIQKRFRFKEGSVDLFAERVNFRGLCAVAQAESLKYKLVEGLAVRRACYGVVKFIMESGAQGCEVYVGGKVRSQRAKGMMFRDGMMIKAGHISKQYVDYAIRHVLLRQGTLGIRIAIMLPHDPQGKQGPKNNLPDRVFVSEPKDDEPVPATPTAPTPAKDATPLTMTAAAVPQQQQQPVVQGATL